MGFGVIIHGIIAVLFTSDHPGRFAHYKRITMEQDHGPINIAELHEIMDHDEELLRECLADFLSDFPQMLDHIKTAIHSGNYEDLEASAHAFKGSLKYLAAFPASDLAFQLETMGKKGEPRDPEAVFSRLEHECARIEAFINSYD